MKKLLILHNKYRDIGGEDIAVNNEVSLLKKFYEVETLIYSNEVENYGEQIFSFLSNNNKKSVKRLEERIENFKPDLVYVHNTWFKASLGVFRLLKEKKIKTVIKLHNFRYECTRSFLIFKHLSKKKQCGACGLTKRWYTVINKYYPDSYFKSFLINNYGKKYLKILKNDGFDLFVLTNFQKHKLKKLGISENRIRVVPNYLEATKKKDSKESGGYFLYAGRVSSEKGINELISIFEKLKLQNIELKIIGQGPIYEKILKDLNSENIEIIGEVPNDKVLDYIKNSKAVVTATKLFEGQPTLLCEASMLGVPSIFPNTGGVLEFFPQDYIYSFEQFNYKDLEEKIINVNDTNSAKKQGEYNKRFIMDYLSKEKIINHFEKILNV
tara:strand:- start:940 stop:2088 length:1149 start_codon:yes stop_codon:yes gene_type:complete